MTPLGVKQYRRKSTDDIKAIVLSWENWHEIGDFLGPKAFIEGVYLDEAGNVVDIPDGECTPYMGVLVRLRDIVVTAVEGDYLIKHEDGEIAVLSAKAFVMAYERIPQAEIDQNSKESNGRAN